MMAPDPSSDPRPPFLQTANDRFKAQGTGRAAWGVTAATGIHAAVFALAPLLEVTSSWFDRSFERPETEVVALEELPPPAEAASPPPPRVGEDDGLDDEEEEGAEEEAGHGDDDGGGLDDSEDGWGVPGGRAGTEGEEDALRRRLGREIPEPEVVDPEEEAPAEESGDREPDPEDRDEEEDEESTEIDGSPVLLDADDLPDADELMLERLAGERPEIAVSAPSHWALVENPEDVRAFMEEAYLAGRVTPGDEGGVLVTIWIDEVGSVEWAEVARSGGNPRMDSVALELFDDVVSFRPAREHGVRVPISVQFWIHFPWRY